MSKTVKEVLSLLLCAALLFGVAPLIAVYAEDDPTFGSCGDNLIWNYDENSTTLTIGSSGEMDDYDYSSVLTNASVHLTKAPWEPFYGKIKKVVINNGVTSIGSSAFCGCKELTSVIIPSSITSIGAHAFYGCYRLTNITIPSSVTSIGDYTFYGCYGLTSITIPDSVTSIGDFAFSGCSGLTSATISKSITSIAHSVFFGCYGLTSISIPNSVTSIGDSAFCNCTGLTSITIPDGVASIDSSAFSGCHRLTSITVPDSVTSIGDSAFFNCTGLISISIPNSVTSIGTKAFHYIANVVYHGSSSGSPWGARSVNGYVEAPFVYADATKETLLACPSSCQGEITVPDSVTTIGESAFGYCTGLMTITIPDNVTFSYYSFYLVPNIVFNGSVTIDAPINGSVIIDAPWGARSVNGYVEYPFVYADETKAELLACCSSYYGELTIPDSVTSINDYAFYNCIGLTSVTIPNSVQSIGSFAFYGCNGLVSMTLPFIGRSKTATGSVLGSIFGSGTKYEVGTIPQYNNFIFISNYCYIPFSLRDITITDITQLNVGAFSNCSFLTNITLHGGVTSIGKKAFYGCSGLTSVTIPNTVTRIGTDAFYDCTRLTSVTIPASVTNIDSFAFSKCTVLSKAYYTGTPGEWDDITISDHNDELLNATIYFINPESCEHDYRSEVTKVSTCTEPGIRTYTCSRCGDSYTESIPAAHTWSKWHTVVYPTAEADGSSERHCVKCEEAETKTLSKSLADCTVNHNRIIGLVAGLTPASFQARFISNPDVAATADLQTLGTGATVTIIYEDNIEVEYEILIFGDVNGDSWYDGTDAYFVRLVASGMVSADALSEAQRMACDCNHDGNIDALDVATLEQAGLLLAQVDQNQPMEGLQTNSVYLEYCGLIDQSVEVIESDQPTNAEEPQPIFQSIWGWIRTLFTIALNWLTRVF